MKRNMINRKRKLKELMMSPSLTTLEMTDHTEAEVITEGAEIIEVEESTEEEAVTKTMTREVVTISVAIKLTSCSTESKPMMLRLKITKQVKIESMVEEVTKNGEEEVTLEVEEAVEESIEEEEATKIVKVRILSTGTKKAMKDIEAVTNVIETMKATEMRISRTTWVGMDSKL
jgi:hypothetical protein